MAESAERPFSNGTEGEAWMGVWCEFCEHDHDITHRDANGGEKSCDLVMWAMNPDDPAPWPEPWLRTKNYGLRLPADIACLMFKPCHLGRCSGDPHAETREGVTLRIRETVLAEARASFGGVETE